MKKITFIVPCFNEEKNIFNIYNEIKKTSEKANNYEFDFIFVDDCSNDNSLTELQNISSKDKTFKYIKLAKNVGSRSHKMWFKKILVVMLVY